MSGGSLDYVYYKVEEAASEVSRRAETPLQKAFAKHLESVAKALHDLEWMWSGDTSEGSEVKAIKECLGKQANNLMITELLKDLDKIRSDAESLKDSLVSELVRQDIDKNTK